MISWRQLFRLPTPPLLAALLLLQILLSVSFAAAQSFDPYELNGGLIAAVAAKDFVVIASDTRFMGASGYDIVSREHVSSRLWMAGDDDSRPMIMSTTSAESNKELLSAQPHQQTTQKDQRSRNPLKTFLLPKSPTFIGSAGCSTDCEALKRGIQADLRQAVYFAECAAHPHPPVDQVATLLSQVLFGRRHFPYYAFCVVAGLSHDSSNSGGEGRVYVYDAIGSYEQVAVATSGTGRDLLQPILDGKFRTAAVAEPSSSSSSLQQSMIRTTTTTVPTQVDCSEEEAISILVDGYRSVSEREIGVGDNMILCVIKRRPKGDDDDGGDGDVECKILTVPLKKH